MPSNSLNKGSSPDELASDPPVNQRLNTPKMPAGLPAERLNIREYLSESWDCEFLFLSETEYDEAIVGVVERAAGSPVIAYNTQKILNILEQSMPMEDAQEHFDYNILGSYMGDKTPVFICIEP